MRHASLELLANRSGEPGEGSRRGTVLQGSLIAHHNHPQAPRVPQNEGLSQPNLQFKNTFGTSPVLSPLWDRSPLDSTGTLSTGCDANAFFNRACKPKQDTTR